jgi:polyphosphate kinase 2 (PPK2 family)
MRRWLTVLLAGAALASPASAQIVERAVPIAPVIPAVPSGAFLNALSLQAQALTAAPAPLPQAFSATVAPTPTFAAAAPEVFAARAALTEALAAPASGDALPALAAAARSADTKKGARAADAIEALHKTILSAPASERRDLAAAAAQLNARFDGATAAPGEEVDLSAYATVEDGPGKKKAESERLKEIGKIRLLQKEMYAGGRGSVLVILDGLDSAGKGGVVDAFRGINPSWTRTEQFKKPTAAEFAEHFLARTRRKAPQAGESKIVFFDRSHYEDLIVPSVMSSLHDKDAANPAAMFSQEEIESRYAQVMAFEREMAARGVTIVKIYLNVSNEEQYARLKDRMDKPLKRWKSPPDKNHKISDHETRKNFDEWVDARRAVLARTSAWWSQWHVIGADDKATRDLAAVRLVRKAMERMGLSFPEYPELDGVEVPK